MRSEYGTDWVQADAYFERLAALEAPQREWASPSVAVEAVLNHERHISARINELVNLANTVKDHATTVVLHWYVNEQVEEEATADTLFHQVRMLEGSPHGLLMLDRELAGRTLSAPPPAE